MNVMALIWNHSKPCNPQFPRMFLEHTPAIDGIKWVIRKRFCLHTGLGNFWSTKFYVLSLLRDFSEPLADKHAWWVSRDKPCRQSFLILVYFWPINALSWDEDYSETLWWHGSFTTHLSRGTRCGHNTKSSLPRAATVNCEFNLVVLESWTFFFSSSKLNCSLWGGNKRFPTAHTPAQSVNVRERHEKETLIPAAINMQVLIFSKYG